MAGYNRSDEELVEKLTTQMKALRSSAAAYDKGELWEAERLAATVYILLHDGAGRTKSLLGQLGKKNSLQYVSTSRGFRCEFAGWGSKLISPEAYPPTPLVVVRMNDEGVNFAPLCEAMDPSWSRLLPFSRWYDEAVFKTASGRELSRKNLIFSLRSQDGGAHIDAHLRDEAYVGLFKDASPQLRAGGKPIPGAHFATMRQITWELEKTLESL